MRVVVGSVSGWSVCIVAVVKGDGPFVAEWVAYHRLIGVDRFFLYDNDPALPLAPLLEPFADVVTVMPWPGDPTAGRRGRNLQTKTYTHALEHAAGFDWVAFLDVDEFVVLREHETLGAFLTPFEGAGSVRLNWHVFGHNGHFEDPSGLITSALTRRMAAPSPRTKAISRPEAIASIGTAHACRLKRGWRTVDANGRRYSESLYPGKTDVAHVNHYQCRSFRSWMARVERGDVSFDRSNVPPQHAWRLDEELCLRQFVETVALDKNELVDEHMVRFERPIRELLSARGVAPPDVVPSSPGRSAVRRSRRFLRRSRA